MRNLQRTAALVTMWAVLWFLYSTGDVDYAWAVFCVGAIALVLEHLAYQMGIAQGIEIYRSLTVEQREEIDRIMDSAND
jgi:hypothetical protein